MGHIILDVAFLLVGIFLILSCAKKGFLKSVLHFFKTILAFVAAYFLGSKLGAFLCETVIHSPIRNFVYKKLSATYAAATDGFDANAALASLPEFLQTEEIRQKVLAAEGSGEQLVSGITDSIATPVANIVSNVIGYIGVFLISLILLWVAVTVLDKVIDHIGILDRLNTILGAVLGLLIALIVLLALSSVVKFFWANDTIYADSVIVKFLGNSALIEKIRIFDLGATWFVK